MADHATAIRNLLYRYTELFDLGRFADAAELFRHAEIVVGRDGTTIDYQALLANWQAMVIVDERGSPCTKHVCSNAIIEVADDALSATARSYYVVNQCTPTLPLQPIASGRYHDAFECVDGQWRFCRRDYRMLEMIGDMSQHIRGHENLRPWRDENPGS